MQIGRADIKLKFDVCFITNILSHVNAHAQLKHCKNTGVKNNTVRCSERSTPIGVILTLSWCYINTYSVIFHTCSVKMTLK